MKTKNNIRKATLKSTAIIASFILISVTVLAQESISELLAENTFGALASELVVNSSNSKTTANIYVMEDFEPALELEVWMAKLNTESNSEFNLEEEMEFSLNIEQWMLQDVIQIFLEIEKEQALELEGWMTKPSF